ncbi:MAG: MiaB/RimO family radical SAM methylthiotransferase [Candidatus Cloacimonetes bacterium]|nr:MiaB/RimO family radical SAM methylthiotransferase [Candidatus Cloacimonadota bacterium]
MKFYIESLGCSKNLVDSERFAAILKHYGFREAETMEDADIILVNSCAFLAASLAELDDVLCDILSERKPKANLVVTGCVMNRAYKEFADLFPEVNKWIGLKDFDAFEKYLLHYVLPKGTLSVDLALGARAALHKDQYVYLRIADGCENYCSYCMIPSIRGKLVSEPIEALVAEAISLNHRGRELVLIAQDSCMYGTDLYGKKSLPELIEALHAIPGYDWIRLMYMHPDHFEPEWTELWNKYPKLLPYFEIPIQHASDRIIHLMNRRKGYQELKQLFDYIKKEIPKAVFRTTLMLGYPTETKKDRDLLDRFLKEVDILHTGVFGYSPEKEDSSFVSQEEFDWDSVDKLETEYAIKAAQAKESKMQRFVGSRQMFLLEGYDDNMQAYVGRLWFQAPEIDGVAYVDKIPANKWPLFEVEVEDALTDELWCSLVEEQKDKDL